MVKEAIEIALPLGLLHDHETLPQISKRIMVESTRCKNILFATLTVARTFELDQILRHICEVCISLPHIYVRFEKSVLLITLREPKGNSQLGP